MKKTVQEISIPDEADDELYEHHRIKVDKGQAAIRIDKFLFNQLQGASRNKIQEAAEEGTILVNDKAVKSNYKVKPLDEIVIVMPHPKVDYSVVPQDLPIDIVYEDEELLVVNKKPGMVVHPAAGNFTGTLVNALAWHFKNLPEQKGNTGRPGLVHRIDKNTSGLLVIAKTEHAMTHLAKQFYDHSIDRTYQAIVWGSFENKTGTIEGNIGRNLKTRKDMQIFPDGDYGKNAITHYKVLEPLAHVSLIECKLETGRTHQIRVHMKYIGHPVFNDETYGGNKIVKGTVFTKYKQFIDNCFELIPRHALHAKTLGFIHPATKKYVQFDSELPTDMKEVINKWKNYSKYVLK